MDLEKYWTNWRQNRTQPAVLRTDKLLMISHVNDNNNNNVDSVTPDRLAKQLEFENSSLQLAPRLWRVDPINTRAAAAADDDERV